jgi:hypothetical protein
MKALIETLSDGTENYIVDLGELGIYFMSLFRGDIICVERWVDHIEAFPEHKKEWLDIHVTSSQGHVLN